MSRDSAGNREGESQRKSSSRKERALEQLKLERERLRQEILLHARELATEMNLRLLLDGETGPGGEDRVFFVESVTVTGIAYPVKRRKSFFGRMKSSMKKAFTYISGLLRPKRKNTGHSAPRQLR